MNDCSINDLKNLSILKNQIVTLNEEELTDIYSDLSSYILFINTLVILINNESALLYFSNNYINKIERIININRFDTSSEIKSIINDIIIYLNNIKNTNEFKKKIITSCYMAYQEDIRKHNFKDYHELMHYIAYDAQIIFGIEMEDMSFLNDEERLLSSINYLLETNPLVFLNSTKTLLNKLDNLKLSKSIFPNSKKKEITEIKKSLKKVKKK